VIRERQILSLSGLFVDTLTYRAVP
jgi:hypothetical protein